MKRKIIISAIVGSLGMSFAASSHAAKPSYYFIKAKHSNKCVSQSGAVKTEGGRVTQWDCIDAPNIKLEKISVGGDSFMLRFPHSDKCLTVEGAKVANGTNIIQSTCQLETAPAEQTWQEVPTSTQPYVQIQSTLGACLHQHGATQENGGNITLWQCVNQPNVEWKFVKADCADYLQRYIDAGGDTFYTMVSNTEGVEQHNWASGKLNFVPNMLLGDYFKGDLLRKTENNMFSKIDSLTPTKIYISKPGFKFNRPILPKPGQVIPVESVTSIFGDDSGITVSFGKGEATEAKVECSRGHMYGFYLRQSDYKNVMFDITLRHVVIPR